MTALAFWLAAETAPASTLAGIIAAFAGVFTSLALVITAIGALKRSHKVEAKVDQVHVIVNQSRTDMLRYQRALVKALVAHGITVPEDQSIDEDQP